MKNDSFNFFSSYRYMFCLHKEISGINIAYKDKDRSLIKLCDIEF